MSQDIEMNYTDHLGELRKRIIWTLVFFIAFFVAGFLNVGLIQDFFVKDLPFELNMTSPGEIIWIYFTMASIVAIVGALPVFSLQIWLFVKPALTPKERKVSLSYIPAIFLLFLGGLTFGYLVFIEMILPFLMSLNDGMFNEIYTVERYFKFLFRVTIPFAVLFEIPVITMFLTSLGIVNPVFLVKVRKYAYFILIIIGTVISPPDFVLQLVVAIPLIILYEISIVLSRIVYRKKLKQQQEFMEDES
ncbi:twin-arginine translocase subunit TatC [Halobacillus yeomjeoni]|uniref:Sec-independent protein translocase protein TatC n=1 Tax=Halobacillus yeomjeoni TaxID=311194 RepID=A0A931HUL9_9BACI|nr:twin-arginine translocase subunit TatC [Halobacillus yeomjeoni]MBH0229511.1 twin-arginine translocase subunit TatC [Halobacillus yeomjeoni]MCA0983088.1 twin-arginine translocase subunit TatC [Halobacillus yeomjeoni]